MLTDKLLELLPGLVNESVLLSVTLLNRQGPLHIGGFNLTPVTPGKILSEQDTQVVPDDSPVKIALDQHYARIKKSLFTIIVSRCKRPQQYLFHRQTGPCLRLGIGKANSQQAEHINPSGNTQHITDSSQVTDTTHPA